MSNTINAQIHVFLVQPISEKQYKEMIVYADTEQKARTAAALADDTEKTGIPAKVAAESIYLDSGMSICIEIKPDIIKADSEYLKVKYNEVIYDLKRDVAQKVISENFF